MQQAASRNAVTQSLPAFKSQRTLAVQLLLLVGTANFKGKVIS